MDENMAVTVDGPANFLKFVYGSEVIIQSCYQLVHANDQIFEIDQKNVHKLTENMIHSMLNKRGRIELVVRRNLSSQSCKCSSFDPRHKHFRRSMSEETKTLQQPLDKGTNKSKKQQKSHEDPLPVVHQRRDETQCHKQVPHGRELPQSSFRQSYDDCRQYTTGDWHAASHQQAVASFSPQQPIGLRNFGNSCYFNAALQILCHTPILHQMLQESNSSSCAKQKKTTITDVFLNFLGEYMSQFTRSGSCSSKGNLCEIAKKLHSTLVQRSVRFDGTRQQDSHELLRHLLDGIRAEEDEKMQSFATSVSAQITTVDKNFCGSFITTFICGDPHCHPYHLCEPFLDISVPIEPPHPSQEWSEYHHNTYANMSACSTDEKKTQYHTVVNIARTELRVAERDTGKFERRNSVQNSLAFLTRLETLDQNDYFCPTCNRGRSDDEVTFCNADKRTLIFSPPAILTIHFKRFYQSRPGVYEKIHGFVSYPELLDITPFCSQLHSETLKVEPVMYSIYGIIAHSGSLNGGHYVAYVKARYTPDLTRHLQTRDWRDYLKGEAKLVEFYKSPSRSKTVAATGTCQKIQGTWFEISDESVHQVSEHDVLLLDNAYMLFYERIQ